MCIQFKSTLRTAAFFVPSAVFKNIGTMLLTHTVRLLCDLCWVLEIKDKAWKEYKTERFWPDTHLQRAVEPVQQ